MSNYRVNYMTHINYAVCIHRWESICGLFSENERHPPYRRAVTYIVSKSGSIKGMMQDRHVVTTHH